MNEEQHQNNMVNEWSRKKFMSDILPCPYSEVLKFRSADPQCDYWRRNRPRAMPSIYSLEKRKGFHWHF